MLCMCVYMCARASARERKKRLYVFNFLSARRVLFPSLLTHAEKLGFVGRRKDIIQNIVETSIFLNSRNCGGICASGGMCVCVSVSHLLSAKGRMC